ncbi:MAG: hypothetical protein DWQ58_15925 [Microcystis aeruginosa TA09]|nr:MAG: hypothetical protein DWQ58_15925 [Microcystis aeruginosa TA09]
MKINDKLKLLIGCISIFEKTGFSEKPVFYSCNLGFLSGNFLLKLGVTFGFITQSKLLGGSTPQTPRWGRGAAPKPPAH